MRHPFVPLPGWAELPEAEMRRRAAEFNAELQRRRTVRAFSDRPVPRAIIEDALRAAGSAPSGAHRQPWHFVAIADAETKRQIRVAAERSERQFYAHAPAEWLAALEPLGTDEHKPYLETAPWLIAVFARRYEPAGEQRLHNYYVMESVGIACGFLLAALHHAGLAALTHTPSPMGFLSRILQRPDHEKPYLLLVTGYPAADATVPDLTRQPLEQISTFR